MNPAFGENIFGLPRFGYMHVHLGHGKHLVCFTVTETLWDRVELGYGLNYMDIGDLPEIEDDTGWDFTLTATKMLDFMPLPTALSVTCRYTEAAHTGLLGFTGERNFVVEANLCVLVLDDLWLAAEYRQKPFTYDDVPGLLEDEDDWWTVDLAYVANEHLTVAVGYGHFGKLLNHRANKVFGVAVKFEF